MENKKCILGLIQFVRYQRTLELLPHFSDVTLGCYLPAIDTIDLLALRKQQGVTEGVEEEEKGRETHRMLMSPLVVPIVTLPSISSFPCTR